MIFHHPLPVQRGAQSASGIRPYQMIEAFRSIGVDVDLVCGYAAERARAISNVERKIEQGVRYAFLYGESSTEPTLLTERHHLPVRPLLDFRFFSRLKAHRLPLGLFYRDIYWRFPAYGASLPWWKAAAAQCFYRYDLVQYRRLIDTLYLPSMAMARHVPWVDSERMRALPPGFVDHPVGRLAADRLRLLYVGGLGAHYRMHVLVRALEKLPHVELTLCTREDEWQAVRHEYPLPTAGNIRVVHCSGLQLLELFEAADLCMLYVEPQPYRDFAAPVKLYEYIGAGRPVIASERTLAGEFVKAHGIGWNMPYEESHIAALLNRLSGNRSLLEEKLAALRLIRHEHTWQARARQVVADLAGSR